MVEAGRKINIDDLKADPLVMFQLRADPWWDAAWLGLGLGLVTRGGTRRA